MAKKINEIKAEAPTAPPSDILASLAGPATRKTYQVRRGDDSRARHCNIQVFGPWGSGKTYMNIGALRLGMKVLAITTDFGHGGFETIYNYFADNPSEAHLLANFREVALDYEGITQFVRDPCSIFPDIYEFDPDLIFWDGGSAFQQVDLEEYIGSFDPLRSEKKGGESAISEQRKTGLFLEQSDWSLVRNGTIRPIVRFLALHNERTGKRWSKVFTCAEESKEDKNNPNAAKTGPLMHTAARKIVGGGFDIILETVRKDYGDSSEYVYISRGADLMTKQRGYGLPTEMPADFAELWSRYIAPRIGWKPAETTAPPAASNIVNAEDVPGSSTPTQQE